MKLWTKYIDITVYKILTLALLTTSCSMLCADWDPTSYFYDKNVSAIEEEKFQVLKEKVTAYLKNSWCSKEKLDLLMDLILIEQPKICVEIGACTGSSVLPVAATLKFLNAGEIYAIDAWSNREVIKHLADNDPNKAWWASVNMQTIYEHFQGMLSTWKLHPYCKPIRLSSEQAINQVNQIDFLHLDGDYSEIGSLRDVELYLPKVKSGGYILLSNLFTMVNGQQPKMKSFCALFESCEMICEIEHDNAILFRKN